MSAAKGKTHMDLTRKQFDVLESLATNKEKLTQRQLEDSTGHSLGTINRVLKELTELGYVENGRITNDGVNALEPYRCKRAIFIAAGGILISMAVIGLGFGMMLDNVTMYAVRLFTIAALLLVIAGTIFLFSVIRHKIRRRFAWIASGIIGLIALVLISAAIPAVSDLSVKESELSAITATVVQTSPYAGFLTGPGKSVIRIKGTSGEMITLRYSGSRSAFSVGKKYTFYYLPHTHLIKKVNPADNVKY